MIAKNSIQIHIFQVCYIYCEVPLKFCKTKQNWNKFLFYTKDFLFYVHTHDFFIKQFQMPLMAAMAAIAIPDCRNPLCIGCNKRC